MKEKKRVLILFGGQSTEHAISCISAATVIRGLDPDSMEPVLVGITEEGSWLLTGCVEQIEDGNWRDSETKAILSPDATMHGLVLFEKEGTRIFPVDVCFPVLHGKNGEDGAIQGMLEMAGIPYVGCGVLASAVSMDKLYTKIIVRNCGIAQADCVTVQDVSAVTAEQIADRVEKAFPYPVFVKPSNAGSSCGVSRADSRSELLRAIGVAAEVDSELLIEEAIRGRELECAVLSDGEGIQASGVGEILASNVFYDYEAKYHSAESRTVVNPELPEGAAEEIRQKAVQIFRAVDGKGFARVDFFLEEGTNRVVFNEINTIPGFTSISMYPMLWEAAGISRKELIRRLIGSAGLRRN